MRCGPPSPPRPPSRSWKTSTFPTSRSAGPRGRSRRSSASSRWPTACSRTRRSTRPWRRRPSCARPKCWTTASRAPISPPWVRCWTACATSFPSAGPKMPPWCNRCGNGSGPKACCAARKWSRRTRPTRRWRSSATISTTTNPSAACRRTARWPCSAGGRWRSWRPSSCCPWNPSPASRALPRAASRCTWAGATRAGRPTT